jgi:hypothetical protein
MPASFSFRDLEVGGRIATEVLGRPLALVKDALWRRLGRGRIGEPCSRCAESDLPQRCLRLTLFRAKLRNITLGDDSAINGENYGQQNGSERRGRRGYGAA